MNSHRYQRVDTHNDDDEEPPSLNRRGAGSNASSPPPYSRPTSPSSRRLLSQDPLNSDADQTLANTFGDDEDETDVEDEVDDRQRLMRGNPTPTEPQSSSSSSSSPSRSQSASIVPQRGTASTSTSTSTPTPTPAPSRTLRGTNDGVFANLAAKPERGEKLEDLPPTYEQAAADTSPPYWETTIVAPGMSSDEVYVDGLPVGSFFSFIWNGMISTSFQLVGFLLTYLLHTTHAAKNGSRAGLGLTLVQYGFYMKGGSDYREPDSDSGDGGYVNPPDPNSHDFDPSSVGDAGSFDAGGSANSALSSISTSEWISYVLMVVGWFILIRAISDFLRARRHEQLVLQSPDRGLPVPVIAEGERSETVV